MRYEAPSRVCTSACGHCATPSEPHDAKIRRMGIPHRKVAHVLRSSCSPRSWNSMVWLG